MLRATVKRLSNVGRRLTGLPKKLISLGKTPWFLLKRWFSPPIKWAYGKIKAWSRIFWLRAVVGVLIGFIILVVIGYKTEYSGFQGKRWWDWLELIIVPSVLGFGALWITQVIQRSERQRAERQAMDATLQSYLDDMADLLIEQNLYKRLIDQKQEQENQEEEEIAEPKPTANDQVVVVARARTVTALHTLDALHRNMMITFLSEAGLITGENGTLLVDMYLGSIDLSVTRMPEINLSHANLNSANLSRAKLGYANLSHAFLFGADLSQAVLGDANLSQAVLLDANLSDADLERANLSKAYLWDTNLSRAELMRADLSNIQSAGGNFSYAKMSGANLSNSVLRSANLDHTELMGANLSNADLEGANLTNAILPSANLSRTLLAEADLTGAKVDDKQLADAQLSPSRKSPNPKPAIMPDGTPYDAEWEARLQKARSEKADNPPEENET